MLNRRHLRIKVLQALYAFFQDEEAEMGKAERQLMFSVTKFHELYIYLLAILQRLHLLRVEKMEMARKRRVPTDEDLNPNLRFVENPFLVELSANKALNKAVETYKIQWDEDRLAIVKDAYQKMLGLPEYQGYMSGEGEMNDQQIVTKVLKECIANNELIQHHLDEMSIFWVDDLDLASSMAIKTIKAWKKVEEEGKGEVLGLYKDEKEEKDFVEKLFRNTILESAEHEELIGEKTKNWDLDRIAYMDMLLMKMALTEARTFKSIPTKVTMNEYLELSKYYSTPKSNAFINGVLDKLFAEMKEDGRIKKIGRGLLET